MKNTDTQFQKMVNFFKEIFQDKMQIFYFKAASEFIQRSECRCKA